MKGIRALCLVLTTLVGASGCVTETVGAPEPASREERLQAQLDLARGYLERGNSERARASLNKALETDPASAEAYVLLAVLNTAEGEWELAEKDFRRALELEPRNAMALNNYASFLYSRGRYDEAVKYLRILVRDPNYRARSQAYENLGLAELKIGDVEAARESFTRALKLNFEQPISSLELAVIAFDEGDLETAARYYDAFRAQAPQTARSLCLGMKIAQQQGDQDRLASFALALNNLYPDSPEARSCTVSR